MNICVEWRHSFFRTPSSNRLLMMTFTVALLALGVSRISARETNPTCPPPTRIDSDSDTYRSTVVPDPYRWLEDQNSKETRAWIEAQNTCTESILSKLPGRAPLTERLTALYRVDTYKPPLVRAGRYFFTKQLASQDLLLIYMRRGTNGVDELLVDPLPWSADHSVSATIEQVSKDGKYLYYGRREGGRTKSPSMSWMLTRTKTYPMCCHPRITLPSRPHPTAAESTTPRPRRKGRELITTRWAPTQCKISCSTAKNWPKTRFWK